MGWFAGQLVGLLASGLICWSVDWFVGWLAIALVWFVGQWIGWMVNDFAGQLVSYLVGE